MIEEDLVLAIARILVREHSDALMVDGWQDGILDEARRILAFIQAAMPEDVFLGKEGLLQLDLVAHYRVTLWTKDGLPVDHMIDWHEPEEMLDNDPLFRVSLPGE